MAGVAIVGKVYGAIKGNSNIWMSKSAQKALGDALGQQGMKLSEVPRQELRYIAERRGINGIIEKYFINTPFGKFVTMDGITPTGNKIRTAGYFDKYGRKVLLKEDPSGAVDMFYKGCDFEAAGNIVTTTPLLGMIHL